jgi:hypothetical protein
MSHRSATVVAGMTWHAPRRGGALAERKPLRNRRLAIAGLALVATLGLAGCGPTEDKAGTGTPPARATGAAAKADAGQADPKAELAAAAAKLGQESMKIDMAMAGALSMTGVVDPQAGTAKMSMKLGAAADGGKMEVRQVGNDTYLKLGGSLAALLRGKSTKPWLHVDAAKLTEGSNINIMPKDDPGSTKALLTAVTKVERVGDHGFRGTIDLTKSPKYNKGSNLAALGAKATNVPFTAKTDGQGRLTELTMDMSAVAAGAGKVKSTYSDFGTPVSVKAPPASEVDELPSELSSLLTK